MDVSKFWKQLIFRKTIIKKNGGGNIRWTLRPIGHEAGVRIKRFDGGCGYSSGDWGSYSSGDLESPDESQAQAIGKGVIFREGGIRDSRLRGRDYKSLSAMVATSNVTNLYQQWVTTTSSSSSSPSAKGNGEWG